MTAPSSVLSSVARTRYSKKHKNAHKRNKNLNIFCHQHNNSNICKCWWSKVGWRLGQSHGQKRCL